MSPNGFSAPERFPARVPPGGVVVDISPEGRAAYERNFPADKNGRTEALEASQPRECQTCKNRKYQDASNDPSVSFQAPAHISPGAAASVVASHEREHVSHEQAKAKQEDRRIVSQTVTLQTAVCPECGRVYVSGGVTRTLTAADRSGEQAGKSPSVGESPEEPT
jgi:ribosomal protein L32